MLQTLIDIFYRHPRSELKKIRRFGGYIGYRRMMYNRNAMEKAVVRLAAVSADDDGLPVYFLTGEKYLYQTLYCIQSLSKHSPAKFKFILVDDGSFTDSITQQISKQLPGAAVICQPEIEKNLDLLLPESSYPVIRRKRQEYPHIKKLTDIHTLPHSDWKLVLDSDMLFYAEPVEMINWLKNPCQPLHMVDCVPSYGYSAVLMQQLAGAKIPPLLNVGAIGLHSGLIDWGQLENWIKILEEKEGKSYYLEQALSAMLIGEKQALILPAEDYIVNPNHQKVMNGSGVLHHYVDLSKKDYFNSAWRSLI